MKKINFKKVICVMLALVLCLPAFASFALESEAEERSITKAPTVDDPTVEVSHPEGAQYQWYVMQEQITEITDADVIEAYGEYDSELGWRPSDATSPHMYFDIELHFGDRLYTSIEKEHYGLYAYSDEGYIRFEVNGDLFESEVTVSGLYKLWGYEFDHAKIYHVTDVLVPVQNQTSATLTEYDFGKEYAVKVTYDDGTILESNILNTSREIWVHPTDKEPAVEVSIKKDASYQWYEADIGKTLIDDEIAFPCGDQSYANGYWEGILKENSLAFFIIEATEGSVVSITYEGKAGDSDLKFECISGEAYGDSIYGVPSGEKTIDFTFYAEGEYVLLANPMADIGKVKANNVRYEKWRAVEGETGATLIKGTPEKAYRVNISYPDGAELISDAFKVNYRITNHPTDDAPFVSTNSDSGVKQYSWYKVLGDGTVYTFIGKQNGYYLDVYSALIEGDKWGSDDGYINIAVGGIKGDVLKVKLPNGIEADVYHYYGKDNFETNDGSTFYSVLGDDAYVDFVIVSDGVISEVEIWLERDGIIIPIKKAASVNETAGEIYVDYSTGTETDGKWTSESGSFYVELTVEKEGTKLVVKGSEGTEYKITDLNGEESLLEGAPDGKYDLDPGIYYLDVTFEGEDGYTELALEIGDRSYALVKEDLWNDEAKTYTSSGLNNGFYYNGRWIPDSYGEIDVELELDKGTTLTVEIGGDFDGEIELDTDSGSFIFDNVGGKLVFTADKHYLLDLEIEGDGDYYAVITVERGTLLEVEGANTKNAPQALGNYFAKLTFADGTCGNTSTVSITKCTHVFGDWQTTKSATKSEAGEEARSCTVCGETETRATDKLDGNGGKIAIIIVCSSVAAAGVGAGAYFFIRKKKMGGSV